MKTLTTVAGQTGWKFSNDKVEGFLTRTGGHLAPVEFKLGRRTVQPFSITPWGDEALPGIPAMLRVARGDFFCVPFGGNAEAFRGERHPPHGETANLAWRLESIARAGDVTTLHASMATRARRGRVDKRLILREGHTAVYCEHVLTGFSGPMPIGTHPMLKFPDEPGSGRISSSGFRRGYVVPTAWERPEAKGYSWLKLGAKFSSLGKVPAADGGFVDLSRYPARRGYEELVELVSDETQRFSWTAVAFPKEGYAFVAIKDPRVLRQSVLWFSNGGRYYPPWNGRHVNVLGVEDVTAFFHLGLSASARANALSRAGSPTAVNLSPRKPLRVAHILALVPIPRGFDEVKSVTPWQGGAKVTAKNGRTVTMPLDLDFVGPK